MDFHLLSFPSTRLGKMLWNVILGGASLAKNIYQEAKNQNNTVKVFLAILLQVKRFSLSEV